jgi:hypothetical protein
MLARVHVIVTRFESAALETLKCLASVMETFSGLAERDPLYASRSHQLSRFALDMRVLRIVGRLGRR